MGDESSPRSLLAWKKHAPKLISALEAENIIFTSKDWNEESDIYNFCCNDEEQYAFLAAVASPYSDYTSDPGTRTVTTHVASKYAKDESGWPASGKWVTITRCK
jgi:hypothetical protein